MMKKSFLERLFLISVYILMILIMFLCAYPFYYLFIYSISDPMKAYGNAFFLPAGLNFDAYIGIIKINYIANAAFISIARTVIGTVITVFCSALYAYILNQKLLPKRKLIYRFVVITMYFNAGLIPWYMTMKTLGLRNNFLLYVLPSAISAFAVVLIRTYLQSLPMSLEESAKLDGAGYFRIFTDIILPISKPIIATIAIFAATAQWNNWADNYFLVPSHSLRTLQLVLYDYLAESSRMSQLTGESILNMASTKKIVITPESIKAAITIVVTLPVILVYPFLQKYLAKGLMIGAIKG